MSECITYLVYLVLLADPTNFAVINVNSCAREIVGIDLKDMNKPQAIVGEIDRSGLVTAVLPDGTINVYEPVVIKTN